MLPAGNLHLLTVEFDFNHMRSSRAIQVRCEPDLAALVFDVMVKLMAEMLDACHARAWQRHRPARKWCGP